MLRVGFQPASPRLGERLKAGMRLHYSSGGVVTPWLVVGVNGDTIVAGRPGCVALRLRFAPTDTVTTERIHCSNSTTMLTWSRSSERLFPARPLSTGELVLPGPAGGKVRYVATPREIDSIGGIPYVVVPTVVETFDADGRMVRRLRERFSLDLATATCGVFEVPDGTTFRAERSFGLVAVTPPGKIPGNPSAISSSENSRSQGC